MKARLSRLIDFGVFVLLAILAYGVVGFLRGRGAIRSCWEQLLPENLLD